MSLRFLHHFIASAVQCRTGYFAKLTTDDIWLLEMASKGTKINLSRFIMNKMLKVLKEKEKEAQKRKKMSQSQFTILYVTLITHYGKSLGIVQPKYEMIPIAVTYNLASITKMGYRDKDNNGIFWCSNSNPSKQSIKTEVVQAKMKKVIRILQKRIQIPFPKSSD